MRHEQNHRFDLDFDPDEITVTGSNGVCKWTNNRPNKSKFVMREKIFYEGDSRIVAKQYGNKYPDDTNDFTKAVAKLLKAAT